MRAVIVIPARMGSRRFPGKVLAHLAGKPLIEHVYGRAQKAKGVEDVIVATDSDDVMSAVTAFGGRAVMTSPDHASGTDRIAEVASGLDCDIIVNVQGDEPLMEPSTIEAVIGLLEDSSADMGTAAVRIRSDETARDPNSVKVVFGKDGFAQYFSRSPIPYHRDIWKSRADVSAGRGVKLYKHIGIYSYRREALMRLSELRPTELEMTERLEQLRALESGMHIKVAVVDSDTPGVDTPEDLERVIRLMKYNL
jgi:3-deoxy-manno-octulosonate cytidylyltransferase (CMP-KDO synthetase)